MPNKFIIPKTDTATRTGATPLEGEILYDTDTDKVYSGDGVTTGGQEIGATSLDPLTLPHTTTPADPGAGKTAVYAKSDGLIYKLAAGGSEENVGGASAFADLSDVDTTGLQTGQAMVWNGAVWVPGSSSSGREVLTADRTYYVRTDGSDSNDGLTDSAGGAFLTIQKAIDVTASLDWSIYNVTIQLGAGTYTVTSIINILRGVGGNTLTIKGATATPTDTKITATSSTVISASNIFDVVFKDLQIECLDPASEYIRSISLTSCKNITFDNVQLTGSNFAIGLEAKDSYVNLQAMTLSGSFYYSFYGIDGTHFSYVDNGTIVSTATANKTLSLIYSSMRFWDITITGSLTAVIDNLSVLTQKSGKVFATTATNGSINQVS